MIVLFLISKIAINSGQCLEFSIECGSLTHMILDCKDNAFPRNNKTNANKHYKTKKKEKCVRF